MVVLKILLFILLSWIASFVTTMIMFYIDLWINFPKDNEVMFNIIKKRHLKLYPFVWLGFFVLIMFLFL